MEKCILYCDHWQNGGVESYLMNQLRHWDLSKMECSILTAEKTTDVYDGELRKLGVQHIVLLSKIYASPIQRILKTLLHCRRYFKQNPCDIAYFNLTNSVTMLYVGFAKWAGVPRRIVHSHNSDLEKGRTRIIKLIAHNLAKGLFSGFATEYWCCSDKAAKFLFPPQKVALARFIPNAIDTETYMFRQEERERIRRQLHCEDHLIVGNVGRCVPQKNQGFLLDVFAELLKFRSDARLLLVGDGPLLPKLKQKAQRLGIQDACIFYGFSDEVPALLSAMDVFCLPSCLEGNPVSAIEAQANGLPCFLADTITRQARILPQSQYLPITGKSISNWVQWILTAKSVDRSLGHFSAKKVGYEIESCAELVQELLLGVSKNKGDKT